MKESQNPTLLSNALAKVRSEGFTKQQELEKRRKQEQAEIERIKKDYQDKIVPLEQKFLEKHVPPVLQKLLNDFVGEARKREFKKVTKFVWTWSFIHSSRPEFNPYVGSEKEKVKDKRQILEMHEDDKLLNLPTRALFACKYTIEKGREELSLFSEVSFTIHRDGTIYCQMGPGGTFNTISQSGLEKLSYFLAGVLERGDWNRDPKAIPSGDIYDGI